jgi:quinol monooxygenase YgiN
MNTNRELDLCPSRHVPLRSVARKGQAMTFIQTISFSTSRMEEMQKLMETSANEARGSGRSSPGFLGVKVVKDRDRENAYMVIAEFESYEVAMENSARPETDAFAKQMAEMSDGPPTFANYDLVYEEKP